MGLFDAALPTMQSNQASDAPTKRTFAESTETARTTTSCCPAPANNKPGTSNQPPSEKRTLMGSTVAKATLNHQASGWCAASNPTVGSTMAPTPKKKASEVQRHPIRTASMPSG